MLVWRCFPFTPCLEQTSVSGQNGYGFAAVAGAQREHSLIWGNFRPDTPAMLRLPTFPRLRRSNIVRPTTPTFLSEVEAAPPTKPVVYSPVPTCMYTCQFPFYKPKAHILPSTRLEEPSQPGCDRQISFCNEMPYAYVEKMPDNY